MTGRPWPYPLIVAAAVAASVIAYLLGGLWLFGILTHQGY